MLKENIRERQLKEKLELDMLEKERHLQESLRKQADLEEKLFKLNLLEFQQKQENERLLKVILLIVLAVFAYLFVAYFVLAADTAFSHQTFQ